MEIKNNPAGRLYDVLYAASQRSESEKCRVVWASVFGVPEKETGLLLKVFADLIDLVQETKKAISSLPDINQQLYLQPFANIESTLSHINFDSHWQPFGARLDVPTLYGLQFAADQLSRSSAFTEIKNEELESLKADLDELVDRVLKSQLPDDIRKLFLRNLEGLRQALFAYRIRGIERLEEEIERTYGSLLRHKDEIRAETKEGEGKEVLKNFVA